MFRQSGNVVLSEGEVFEKSRIEGNLYFQGGRISKSVSTLTVDGSVFVDGKSSVPGDLKCEKISAKADLSVEGDLQVSGNVAVSKGNITVGGSISAGVIDSSYSMSAGSITCDRIIAGNDLTLSGKLECTNVSVGGTLKAGEIKCEDINTDSIEAGRVDCTTLRTGSRASISTGRFDSVSVEGSFESSDRIEASVITVGENAMFNNVKCGVMNIGETVVSKGLMEVAELKTGESLECDNVDAQEILVSDSIRSSGSITASGDVRARELITVLGEIKCNTLEGNTEISAGKISCKMNLECKTLLHTDRGASANIILLGKDCTVAGPISAEQIIFSGGVTAQDVYAVILHMKNGSSAVNVYADEITMWKNSTIKGKCLYRHWIRNPNGIKIENVGEKVEKLPEFPG